MAHPTRFNRAYFERWCRNPRTRVLDRVDIARRVALLTAIAEYLLERRVRSVLDVGCGEGNWRAPLLALRPRIRYTGVDPSEYAVRRFGHRRNITLGSTETLETIRLRGPFDMVIASGVLNFLSDTALSRAARVIARLTSGVAFLELFTTSDDVIGDTRGWKRRSAVYYRRMLNAAGLVQCGPHCYVPRAVAQTLSALELTS
jgi:SAM-dependent methyltransferase